MKTKKYNEHGAKVDEKNKKDGNVNSYHCKMKSRDIDHFGRQKCNKLQQPLVSSKPKKFVLLMNQKKQESFQK